MSALIVFVDYDNVEPMLKAAGPVSLAKVLIPLIPDLVIQRHTEITVRLYGGWRSHGSLTNFAQQLIPAIRAASPVYVVASPDGLKQQMRLTVELADKPIGLSVHLAETFVKERDLRNFRARRNHWIQCATPSACGFAHFAGMTYASPCGRGACTSRLIDVFVRDEQKMVDTLLVADIAQKALSDKATDVVVVSSDTDMWPGVLLALRAGCCVTHIHTKPGRRTQGHLLHTLGGMMSRLYQQVST